MLNSIIKGWLMQNPHAKIADLSSLAETVAMAKDIASWTPDAVQLEKKAYQPLFVCCQLGKGGREHSWLEGHYKETDDDGRSANMSLFTKDRFELWQANRGPDSYPVPLRTSHPAATWTTADEQQPGNVKAARIKGKLYQVRSDVVFTLDRLRHNGVVYHRELIDTLIPFRYLGGHQLGEARLSHEYVRPSKAWFYIAENDYWEPLLDGGIYFKPARLSKPRNPHFRKWDVEPHYMFNPREYASTE